MKQQTCRALLSSRILVLMVVGSLSACDRNSSPEGRMSVKLESLQEAMMDSLRQQNKAILDSLSQLRQDLKQMQQTRK